MRRPRSRFPAGMAAAAVLGLVAGLSAAEKEAFRGRILMAGFSNNITIKIEVSDFSTLEEIAALREALDQGEGAFRKVFRKTVKGNLMFYGVEQPSVKFFAAFETPTEKGRAISLFSENRTILSGPGQAYTGLLFLVATLEIDAEGNGEGRLYESAYIQFTPDGRLGLESFRAAPAQIIQVRRAK
ncbi:MAG: hypothetical protein FJY82_15375 [Candidatus Aminicenantes bacterium]|nr:hypothetical protein [Candidatus Aminicenantes bacterium]